MDHVTLTLKPETDRPQDLPFRAARVDVPLHSEARPIEVDRFWTVGFPFETAHRSRAEAVSYLVPLKLAAAFEWFDELFSRQGYTRRATKGQSGNTRTGERTDWMVLNVSPPENPHLIVQLTFRPHGAHDTLLTYRAEEHPLPPRDPASYLPSTVARIEVEYMFMNGPQPKVRRAVTSPSAIKAIVDAISALPCDNRPLAFGLFDDQRADLRFILPDGEARHVHVNPAHSSVVITGFLPLFGSIWPLLLEVAHPGEGARGI